MPKKIYKFGVLLITLAALLAVPTALAVGDFKAYL